MESTRKLNLRMICDLLIILYIRILLVAAAADVVVVIEVVLVVVLVAVVIIGTAAKEEVEVACIFYMFTYACVLQFKFLAHNISFHLT